MFKKINIIRISLKRRCQTIFYNGVALVKILIILSISIFIYTNYSNRYIETVKSKSSNFLKLYGFSLQNILIYGQKNTSCAELIQDLQLNIGAPIFSINIQEVKRHLEENAWIKKAIISRRLPSTIHIEIFERTPIAIWQIKKQLYLVDDEGRCIASYRGSSFSELLHAVGENANIHVSSLLKDLDIYPDLAKKIKSAVRYGNRRWNLHLDQKILVKMPENSFDEAYRYLFLLHQDQKLFNQNYRMLDLRDSNKYYIEYKYNTKI